MLSVATVPSAQNGTISLQFNTQQNQLLATQLLNTIYQMARQSKLNAQNAPTSPPFVGGDLNEFTLGFADQVPNSGPRQASVPAGYSVVINAFTDGPATITGPAGGLSQSVLSGQGGLTYFLNGGSGTVLAGGGNNLIAPGPSPQVASGGWTLIFDGGNNTVYGTGGPMFVSDGSAEAAGSNVIFLGSGPDTVQSWGNDVIIGSPGAPAVVATYHAGTVYYAGNGSNLLYNVGGRDTFVGSGGQDTVYAEVGGGLYYGNGPLTFVAAPGTDSTVLAGRGNAVAFCAANTHNLFFVGPAQLILDGGAGSQTVVGSAALTGNGPGALAFSEFGGSITLFGDTNNNFLMAGGGNVTLNAAGSTGSNVLYAGSGNDCILAGAGNTWIVGGPGSDTLIGSAGTSAVVISAAFAAGGDELIANWNGNDQLFLSGYGGVGPNGLPAGATLAVVNGSDVLTLVDGTRITFLGAAINPSQIHSG